MRMHRRSVTLRPPLQGPASPARDACLALAAERDLPRRRDVALAKWLEEERSRSVGPPHVDRYGRLSLDPSSNTMPIDRVNEIVGLAWRHRYIDNLDHFARVGHALQAIACSARHARSPMGRMLSLVRTATSLGRFCVLRNRDGETAGFFIWLHLSDRTLGRLRLVPFGPIHPSEWNEGPHRRIRDASFLASGMVAWLNAELRRRGEDV